MDQRPATTPKLAALALSSTLALFCGGASAQVEIESKGMTVTGQRELPKVLYIVPWKRMQSSEIEAPQTSALVADVLDPIDPASFRKRLQYFEILDAN